MTLNVIHKLLMLTNGDILETSGEDAYIKRQSLVSQVFNGLPAKEQDELFDIFLFNDMMRVLKKMSRNKFSFNARAAMTRQAMDHMKQEHLRQSSSQPKQLGNDRDGWGPF